MSGGSGRSGREARTGASSGGTPAGPRGLSPTGSPAAVHHGSNLGLGGGCLLASQPLKAASKESLQSATTGPAAGLPTAFTAAVSRAAELPPLQLQLLPEQSGSLHLALSADANQLAAALCTGQGGQQPPASEQWDSLLIDFNSKALEVGFVLCNAHNPT